MVVQNLQADRLVVKYLGLRRNQELQVYQDYFWYWRFSPQKSGWIYWEINCRRADWEKVFCFPVKKTSNCAKQGFAVTFSWIDKARIVIHFLFENGVLYNSALVGMRLIVGSESGTTPSPFKPTTKKMNKCLSLKSSFTSSIPLVRWYLSMTKV